MYSSGQPAPSLRPAGLTHCIRCQPAYCQYQCTQDNGDSLPDKYSRPTSVYRREEELRGQSTDWRWSKMCRNIFEGQRKGLRYEGNSSYDKKKKCVKLWVDLNFSMGDSNIIISPVLFPYCAEMCACALYCCNNFPLAPVLMKSWQSPKNGFKYV